MVADSACVMVRQCVVLHQVGVSVCGGNGDGLFGV